MLFSTPAIVLLGHGSRRTRAARPFAALCRLLHEAEGRHVADAYLSLCSPTLEQAVEGLMDLGYQDVDIVPMFLVEGHHVQEDLPRAMQDLSLRYPGLRLRLTPHLGADEAILPLLSRRLAQAKTPQAAKAL